LIGQLVGLLVAIIFCAILGLLSEPLRFLLQSARISNPSATPTATARSIVTVIATIIVPTPTSSTPTPTVTARSEVMGFYVNWDANSFTSLEQHINSLDKLIPEWLHLADSSGAIVPDDLAIQQQTLDFIKSARPNLPIIVMINNYNNEMQDWDRSRLITMLASPAARARNIQALLDFVQTNHFQGISIDFESVPSESSTALTTYMSELYAHFHPLGLEVSQSVSVNDPGFDYPNLIKYTDYLILMVYDEHWSTSKDGPVASQQMFANALSLHLSHTDPSKYIIGIGNYGYDWIDGTRQGVDISFEDAIHTAQKYDAKVAIDPVSLNPTYDYKDGAGKLHHVWFLDASTALNQIAEAQHYQVRGFAMWRMGSEDPAIWQVFDQQSHP
jgi:spore germination protein YaaH